MIFTTLLATVMLMCCGEPDQPSKGTDGSPVASVTVETPGSTSAILSVRLIRAERVWLLALTADDSKPAASEVREAGTSLPAGKGTLEGLKPSTDYVLYYCPESSEGKLGNVSSVEFRTISIEPYAWEKSRDGIPFFAQTALIYGGGPRTPKYWTPERIRTHVSWTDPDTGEEKWLFDAFLMLEMRTPANNPPHAFVVGIKDWSDPSIAMLSANQKDASEWLDYWFLENNGFWALDAAVAEVTSRIGPPPVTPKVIVMMPDIPAHERYNVPGSSTKYWGSVDGRELDFTSAADRVAAYRWYVDEVRTRFADANFQNIELGGFYIMTEELPSTRSGIGGNGGDHVDGGTSRFDRLATLYQSVCASCGGTNAFPTTAGAWSDSNRASNCNNAVFRFEVADDFPVAEFVPPETGCAPYTVHFNNTGRATAYHWDFGDGATSTARSPIHTYATGGIYTVTLVASMPGGCSEADTQRHTVQVLSQTGSLQQPRLSCGGTSIQIGPQPQLGATYVWLSGSVSDPTVANPWVSEEGRYILRINATGCTQTDTFVVETYTLVSGYTTLPVSCHDSTDGVIVLLTGDGIAPDSLAINITPSATWHHEADSLVFANLHGGTYHVVVSGYGCTYEQDITLHDPETPRYTKELSQPLCTDTCNGWIHITYDIGGAPQDQGDTLIGDLCEGTYITRLTTLAGCPLVDTSVILRDRQLDSSLHVWADSYEVFLGESVGLHADVAGDGVSFMWSPATDIDNPTDAEPTATPTDTAVCYTVTATTQNGCSASDSVCLHCTTVVCGAPLFTIHNAFSPNGDGINDRLCFNTDELLEFHIAIFNRWGERVYESDDPSQCWDGTYRGNMCMPGVYTYTCHIRCHADKENDFKGDITLIR